MTLYSNFVESGRKNVLFNGNFTTWSAGTSWGATVSGTKTADMMTYGESGSVIVSNARSTIVPNSNAPWSYYISTTTAQASFIGVNHSYVYAVIEGYDFVPFIGKTATLSFWVRGSVTGIYSVSFRNTGSDRTYMATYTIDQADTWEKKSITLKFDYSGGTWDYINGVGLRIGFCQACGTTYATSSVNQWLSVNYLAATGQVNGCATIGNTIRFSQMQLELGSVATSFEQLDIALVQENAERYYQIVTPNYLNSTSVATGTGNCYSSWDFHNSMRAAPSITHAGLNFWQGAVGWVAPTGVVHSPNTYRCLTRVTAAGAAYVVGYSMLLNMAAYLDARL